MIHRPRQLGAVLHFWYSLADLGGVFECSIFPSLRNPMGLINDFCGPNRAWDRKQALPPPNCRYMSVRVGGWPMIFVVATRHIGVGERLLIDYGDAFWAHHDKLADFESVG